MNSDYSDPNRLQDEVEFLGEEYQPANDQFRMEDVPSSSAGPSRLTNMEAVMPSPGEPLFVPKNMPISVSDIAVPPSRFESMGAFLEDFWQQKKRKMSEITEQEMKDKSKHMSLPMARVKKIMKIDDDVRKLMIASDAPFFMSQVAEFFIEEMTGMGWHSVSESRRRILQKADIASAMQNSEQYDFLIDLVPRDGSRRPRPKLTEMVQDHAQISGYFIDDRGQRHEIHQNPGDEDVLDITFDEEGIPSREIPDDYDVFATETPNGPQYRVVRKTAAHEEYVQLYEDEPLD